MLSSQGWCENIVATNSELDLRVQKNPTSIGALGFDSWSGVTCDEGQISQTCSFDIAQDTNITLNFKEFVSLFLTVVDTTGNNRTMLGGDDNGTVSCSPYDSNFKTDFVKDTVLILSSDYLPANITCSGVACNEGQNSATCTFTLNEETRITATYN